MDNFFNSAQFQDGSSIEVFLYQPKTMSFIENIQGVPKLVIKLACNCEESIIPSELNMQQKNSVKLEVTFTSITSAQYGFLL